MAVYFTGAKSPMINYRTSSSVVPDLSIIIYSIYLEGTIHMCVTCIAILFTATYCIKQDGDTKTKEYFSHNINFILIYLFFRCF